MVKAAEQRPSGCGPGALVVLVASLVAVAALLWLPFVPGEVVARSLGAPAPFSDVPVEIERFGDVTCIGQCPSVSAVYQVPEDLPRAPTRDAVLAHLGERGYDTSAGFACLVLDESGPGNPERFICSGIYANGGREISVDLWWESGETILWMGLL